VHPPGNVDEPPERSAALDRHDIERHQRDTAGCIGTNIDDELDRDIRESIG
jgi:hypothetical protein